MPTFRKEASVGALIILAGFLTACASTTMQSMQRSPDFQTANLHKVLVVCLTSTPGMRDQLESEFARQWKERRVLAMPSSQVLPPDVTLDKAGIAPYAKAHGFDAVLGYAAAQARKDRTPNRPTEVSRHAASSNGHDIDDGCSGHRRLARIQH